MHIPKGTTGQCDLPPFEELLKEARTPGHGYDCDKWLYVPARYEEYRYILATTGQKPLICIGVNPSTAAPGDLDNTLKSVERIALGNGFDSFVMFNLYAQRATDPDSICTRRTWRRSLISCKTRESVPPSGRRGERSSKSARI